MKNNTESKTRRNIKMGMEALIETAVAHRKSKARALRRRGIKVDWTDHQCSPLPIGNTNYAKFPDGLQPYPEHTGHNFKIVHTKNGTKWFVGGPVLEWWKAYGRLIGSNDLGHTINSFLRTALLLMSENEPHLFEPTKRRCPLIKMKGVRP